MNPSFQKHPIPPVDRGSVATAWIPDTRGGFVVAALVWVLVVQMIVPDGLNYSGLSTTAMPTAGSPISRLLWMALLGVAGLLLVWRARMSLLVLRSFNPWLLAFFALMAASLLWSIEPAVTLRRLIRGLTVLLVALAFVSVAWHPNRFQQVVRPIITLMLFGSIVFGLTKPHLAIAQSTAMELVGAWNGLTMQKNSLGMLASIGVVLWFHGWLMGQVRGSRAIIGGGIALTCLVLSRSSTSLMTTVLVIVFLLLLLRTPRTLRPYMAYLVAAFVAFLLFYSLVVLRLVPGLEVLLKPITVITGKDLTFSNRLVIWQIMTEHVATHPFLGVGYGAFWTGATPASPSYDLYTRMAFYPGSAHNGYIEVLNDLGIVGLSCLLAYLVIFVRQSLILFRSDRGQGSLFLALFLQQAVANLSESHWLSVFSFGFVITTLVTATQARLFLDQQFKKHFGATPAPDDHRQLPALTHRFSK